MYAIETKDLNKSFYENKVLKNVELKIKKGDFFGLLGPNGAGKTTLINIIAGLTIQDSGYCKLHGLDSVEQSVEIRRLLGVVPQELVFDPFFTVWETLQFQSGYFGVTKNDKWLNEILNNLGLESKKNSNMRSLSGGMKRRVLVAQALVHKPPVIILDEPTAGVDIELRKNIWTFIKKLNSEGHTIVLTTHYLEEAENLCNKIAMLKEGKIVAFDYTRKLLNRITGIKLLIGVDLKKIKLPNDFSHPYNVDNNELIFHLNTPLEVEEILRTFRRKKINIQSVKADSSDLEDVFMKIIKNNDKV